MHVQLLVASRAGSALAEEKTGSMLPTPLKFIPLDLLIPLWELHPKGIAPAPFPLHQKRQLQNFSQQRNKTAYISLKRLGTLTQKNEVK